MSGASHSLSDESMMRCPLNYIPKAQTCIDLTANFGHLNIIIIIMIGAIIGAAGSVASSIIGGVQAKKAAEKANNELQAQRQKNEDWYRRRYNEDYTQSAEAQAAMTKARELAQEQMKAARGTAAVMGGTEAGVAAQQAAANKMLSDTMSGIAAQGTARKDAVESQYLQTEAALSQQQQNVYNQQAANATAAANAGMQAGMSLLGADAQSYMDRGKGLFGEMWLKNKGQRLIDNLKVAEANSAAAQAALKD